MVLSISLIFILENTIYLKRLNECRKDFMYTNPANYFMFGSSENKEPNSSIKKMHGIFHESPQ